MDSQSTVGAQFKTINILHIAMCLGVVLFLAVFRYLVKQDTTVAPEKNIIFEILGIAIGFVCVMAARLLFFSRTKAALTVSSLKEKIDIFRSAFIIQMALLEGAAFINIVFYYLTKDDLHFFISLGILLLMIVRRPTRSIAAMVLFNNMEDKQQIYDDSMLV